MAPAISTAEVYRRECAAIALADDRWTQETPDDCVVCGAFTPWCDPDQKHRCPGCWNWIADPNAASIPLNEKPVKFVKRDPPPARCVACGCFDIPMLEWKWAGERKNTLAIGAYCVNCKMWIKWVPIQSYEQFAPHRPPLRAQDHTQWLFDPGESESKISGYTDTSAGDLLKKNKANKPLPPPLKEKPISQYDVAKTIREMLNIGQRLYLDSDGNVCCTASWSAVKDQSVFTVRTQAVMVKRAMAEDFLWQIRASACSPHVIHVHPRRTSFFDQWDANGRPQFAQPTIWGREMPDIPHFFIDCILETEKIAIGDHSHIFRSLSQFERNALHDELIVWQSRLTQETGGLF